MEANSSSISQISTEKNESIEQNSQNSQKSQPNSQHNLAPRYSKINQCPIWKDTEKTKKIGFLLKDEKCEVKNILCEGEWLEIVSEKEKYYGFVQSHLVGKTELVQSIETQLKSLTEGPKPSESKKQKDEDEDNDDENVVDTKSNQSSSSSKKDKEMSFTFQTIGIFHSIFPDKNGTPRNAGISNAKGFVQLTLPNSGHFIDGLQEYSHLMIFWIFHQNTATRSKIHPKIRPPRLEGEKVGVLATRTPHRPNPIGFSVVKIDSIDFDDGRVYCIGADIVDGTPILDIKPYIPEYDAYLEENTSENEINSKKCCKIPNWMQEIKNKRIDEKNIKFDPKSLEQLTEIYKKIYLNKNEENLFNSEEEIKKTIIDVLTFDPRPEYVRRKNNDKLYGVRLDKINVRCAFDKEGNCTIKEIEEWQS